MQLTSNGFDLVNVSLTSYFVESSIDAFQQHEDLRGCDIINVSIARVGESSWSGRCHYY